VVSHVPFFAGLASGREEKPQQDAASKKNKVKKSL